MVPYHRIFASRKLDKENNNELKIELNPKHDESVYGWNQATPTILEHEMLVERLQKNGTFTNLPVSTYPSPSFGRT